jgi:oligogalacturonide lyase
VRSRRACRGLRRAAGLAALAAFFGIAAEPPPREWADTATGHRVIRPSDDPNTLSLYFHQNAFTQAGDLMVYQGPRGLYWVDLRSRESKLLVEKRVAKVVAGRKS